MAFIKSFFPRGNHVLDGINDEQANLNRKPDEYKLCITSGTKQVIAFFKSESLPAVSKALNAIGINSFIVRDVKIIRRKAEIKHGSQDGHNTPEVLDGLEIMMITQAQQVQEIIDAILTSAREDFQSRNGGIIVMAVEEMIQVNLNPED